MRYNNLASFAKPIRASVKLKASFESQYAKQDMFDLNMVTENAILES